MRYAVGAGPHGVHDLVAQHSARARRVSTWDDYLEQGVLAALDVGARDRRQQDGQCARILRRRHAARLRAGGARGAPRDAGRQRDVPHHDARLRRSGRHRRLRLARSARGARAGAAAAAAASRAASWPARSRACAPNELVWNYVVSNYLKGETPPAFDLLYWNGDSANLPGPMYVVLPAQHVSRQRLREPGALSMCGEPIDLDAHRDAGLRLATREDHIVPWRTAYKSDGPARRRLDVRARRLGSHRRRDQSAGEKPAQLLDQ